jgi:hypothetical protein
MSKYDPELSDISLPCGQLPGRSPNNLTNSFAGLLEPSGNAYICQGSTPPRHSAVENTTSYGMRTIATQTGRSMQCGFFNVNHWLNISDVSSIKTVNLVTQYVAIMLMYTYLQRLQYIYYSGYIIISKKSVHPSGSTSLFNHSFAGIHVGIGFLSVSQSCS